MAVADASAAFLRAVEDPALAAVVLAWPRLSHELRTQILTKVQERL
jgi:hypothetical protein